MWRFQYRCNIEELIQFDPTKIEYKYLDREKELKEINVNEV